MRPLRDDDLGFDYPFGSFWGRNNNGGNFTKL